MPIFKRIFQNGPTLIIYLFFLVSDVALPRDDEPDIFCLEFPLGNVKLDPSSEQLSLATESVVIVQLNGEGLDGGAAQDSHA